MPTYSVNLYAENNSVRGAFIRTLGVFDADDEDEAMALARAANVHNYTANNFENVLVAVPEENTLYYLLDVLLGEICPYLIGLRSFSTEPPSLVIDPALFGFNIKDLLKDI